ncbi:MAG: hypothetical protein ACREJ2_12985 [Planctomycetota bacterium]
MLKATGETELHRRLKWAAAAVLLLRGLPLVGLEVRVPGLRRRADVAGVGDLSITARRYSTKERATKDAYIGVAPTATLAEIKASRADLLRDLGDRAELLDKLGRLHAEKLALEESIRQTEPHLSFQPNLLIEERQWRYGQSINRAYKTLTREFNRTRAQVFGKTKFDTLARSGVADEYLLVTAPGICRREEIPEHWGWMTIDCDSAVAALRLAASKSDPAALELPELGWGPGWELSYKHTAVEARWMQPAKAHEPVAIAKAARPRASRRKLVVDSGDQGSLFTDPAAHRAAAAEAEAVARGAAGATGKPNAATAVLLPDGQIGANARGRLVGSGGALSVHGEAGPVAVWIYPGVGAVTLQIAPKRFSCSPTARRKWERSLAQSGSALLRQLLSGRLHGEGTQSAGLPPGGVPFHAEE